MDTALRAAIEKHPDVDISTADHQRLAGVTQVSSSASAQAATQNTSKLVM